MRAGQLKECLVFESATVATDCTGAEVKTWTECFRCRAYRKKQQAMQGDEQAMEVFLGQTVVMLTWNYPEVDYAWRVRWAGWLWQIRLIERTGAEMTITLRRIDE